MSPKADERLPLSALKYLRERRSAMTTDKPAPTPMTTDKSVNLDELEEYGCGDTVNRDLAVAAVNALPALLAERKRLLEAQAAISRAHGSLHLGDTDGVDQALEEARAALAGAATTEEEQG
jgi:hypothetical protein